MSSPEPHGSSGFTDSEPSAESVDFQQHPYIAARIAAVTGEGSGYNFYTHPARTSVLDANGDLILDPTLRLGPAPAVNSTEMDYAAAQGDMANAWRTTGGSLPSFSRAFDFFAAEPASTTADDDRFFVPSYLRGSTYVQKLEEAYNKKLEAQKEVKRSKGNGQDINTTGLSTTPLPAGAHRGMLHTVLERAPFEDGDSLAPLPRHWNTADMWTSIEVMPNMLGLKFLGPKNHHDREHEASAIRADHFMPPQCGIYYYEVHIISGKQDEYVIASSSAVIARRYQLTAGPVRPLRLDFRPGAHHCHGLWAGSRRLGVIMAMMADASPAKILAGVMVRLLQRAM